MVNDFHQADLLGPNVVTQSYQGGNGGGGDFDLFRSGWHPYDGHRVTGGAIGLGIGVGLQKIGSNIMSGIMLLISKPIRQGDVIAFPKGSGGASWGWIKQMGLIYSGGHATRIITAHTQ